MARRRRPRSRGPRKETAPPVTPTTAGKAGSRRSANSRRLMLVAATAGVLLVAAVLLVLRPPIVPPRSDAPFPPPPAAAAGPSDSIALADFTGAESCAGCHRVQYDAWRQSTHAAAGGAPGEVRLVAPFDGTPFRFRDAEVVPRTTGTVTFTVRQRGMPERTLRVDAVVGGGHLQGGGTQGFLTRAADGTYRFLPFDWSRHTATWFCNTIGRGNRGWVPITADLSITDCVDWPPTRILGEEPRFSNCQSCHGSQIEVRLDTTAQTYRTRFTSLRIECESCHGPGRRHVSLVRDSAARASGDIGMAALATLDKDASLAICWRCHTLKDQLREGYLPGRGLARFYSINLPQLGDAALFPDGRVRTFAYQESHRWSDCYRNGGMTCTSCHEPHGQGYRDVAGRPLASAFDDRQCTGCHAAKADSVVRHTHHPTGSPGSACVSCHMPYLQQPELGTAVRYARADHSIPIPRPAHEASLGITSACRTCHAEQTEAALDAQVRAWYGALKPLPDAVTAQARARERGTRAAAARLLLVPDEAHTAALFSNLAWFVETHLAPDLPDLERDVRTRLQALARHPDLDVRSLALAALHYARGTFADDRRFLIGELRELGDADPLVRARWVMVLGYLADRQRANGDPSGAIATYRKALEIDPRQPRILLNLALAQADAHDLGGAVASYQASLALDPVQPLTLVNLGIAYITRGDPPRAIDAYRRALALNPREPLAWFNLGVAQATQNAPDSALASFSRAVAEDPSLAIARFLMARIHLQRNDQRSALREIEAGLVFDPGNAEAQAMRERLRRGLATSPP